METISIRACCVPTMILILVVGGVVEVAAGAMASSEIAGIRLAGARRSQSLKRK
jgi:hypothetical protein